MRMSFIAKLQMISELITLRRDELDLNELRRRDGLMTMSTIRTCATSEKVLGYA